MESASDQTTARMTEIAGDPLHPSDSALAAIGRWVMDRDGITPTAPIGSLGEEPMPYVELSDEWIQKLGQSFRDSEGKVDYLTIALQKEQAE